MPLSDSDVKGSIKRLRLEPFYHTFTECGDFRQILILQIKKAVRKRLLIAFTDLFSLLQDQRQIQIFSGNVNFRRWIAEQQVSVH